MELLTLSFGCNLRKRKFSHINYEFCRPPSADAKSSAEQTKVLMESLEHLLDGYLGKMFYSKKKQKGVSSQGAEFGCDYVSSLIGVLLEWGFGFYKLRCEVPLNNTGRNFGGIKLSLYNQNTNSARVLELHDLVVAIPDLKISCEAAAHLDSIDYLRGKESSQERYLGLIGAQKK